MTPGKAGTAAFTGGAEFATDAAARKVQIANASEAVQDGRIDIELLNSPLPKEAARRTGTEPRSRERATSRWLWLHEFRTYVKFTPAGAELFA